ncbi:MAG: hypothetical protein HY898_19580 [Deltaproteobacteria bacterium]|nr:hypothetical protein [Deltaproteobacteria bacterium]
MSRARSALALLSLAISVASIACVAPPRPPVLADAERASHSPASAEAAKLVPQAFSRAEQLRSQADEAFARGEISAATILAERALAAYEHAAVLAEIARAIKVTEAARQQLMKSEDELRALDAEQARLAADAEALEVRIKVLKDAEPVAGAGRADPAREAARLSAARAIILDARLLCVSARLVDAKAAGMDEAEADVQKLETSLASAPKPAPIDDARRLRARCLALLTAARRAASSAASSGASDVVLSDLSSKLSLAPYRDDRGVVVAVPGELVTKPGDRSKAAISAVAGVANAHPEFPLLLVSHAREPGAAADLARARANADALGKMLTAAGVKADRIRAEQAGAAQPVGSSSKTNTSERIEIVFVSPGT